uniref:Uncharacterized protein n=1 Tax=Sphaerodactylus townsendi TaxID=933632 RepID=A0ACB8FV79_9SAUR
MICTIKNPKHKCRSRISVKMAVTCIDGKSCKNGPSTDWAEVFIYPGTAAQGMKKNYILIFKGGECSKTGLKSTMFQEIKSWRRRQISELFFPIIHCGIPSLISANTFHTVALFVFLYVCLCVIVCHYIAQLYVHIFFPLFLLIG